MAYRTLMDSLKLKQEEVANRVGKSRSYVANFLRLLTLPVPCARTRSKWRVISRTCTYFTWIKRPNENLTSR